LNVVRIKSVSFWSEDAGKDARHLAGNEESEKGDIMLQSVHMCITTSFLPNDDSTITYLGPSLDYKRSFAATD
jgi:hypothetical protein